MSGHDDELARLLAAVAEEEPPRGLRERVLASAEAALCRPAAADPWRRLWESRPLRIVWATAVVLLVSANLALRTGSPARPPAPSAAAAQERAGLKELQAVVELPQIRLHGTGIDFVESRAAAPHVREPKTTHHDMEGTS